MTNNKRNLLLAILMLLSINVNGVFAQGVRLDQSRPNVLLVVADDLGVGDLHSFYANAVTTTPNIDALAQRGMRFTRFYTDSTCSASRAALLTGQNPARLGFHPVARGIASEVVTMADWLRQQGYSTHHVGKWHVGELYAESKPAAQGFDSSFGYLNQWFLQGPDSNGQPVLRSAVYENPWLENETGDWRQYNGYLPDILTENATAQIHDLATAGKPWFMLYATPLPHGPLHLPPPTTVENATVSDEEKYQAMVARLDRNIAELLAALDSSGQRDNTLVIFLSDNGAPEKRIGSNAALGGGKYSYSEGGIRAPLVWMDPYSTIAGSLDERVISIMDIFPVLAARIGAPLPFATDGIDISSLGNIIKVRDRTMFWLSRESYSVLSANKAWRLSEMWIFREVQAVQLMRIADVIEEMSVLEKYWHFRTVQALQKTFLAWWRSIERVAVDVATVDNGYRVQGNDFLRTPLKDWDFYLAVRANTSVQGQQVLAEQHGIWSLRYDNSSHVLQVIVHGQNWAVPMTLSDSCTLLGLNADIYDKYTNVNVSAVHPSLLRISVNGVEVWRTEQWNIDSLAGISVEEPTWIGRSTNGEDAFAGEISRPVFLHQGSVVGEFPFLFDEAGLRNELCAQF